MSNGFLVVAPPGGRYHENFSVDRLSHFAPEQPNITKLIFPYGGDLDNTIINNEPTKRLAQWDIPNDRGYIGSEPRARRSPRSSISVLQEDPDDISSPRRSSQGLRRPEPLSLHTELESPELSSSAVHKFWGMLRLDSEGGRTPVKTDRDSLLGTTNLDDPPAYKGVAMDFVVMIDCSSSMSQDNKMAFMKATIEYMVNRLGPQHRFCLLAFNQEAIMITEGLVDMTEEKKKEVLALMKDIKPEGSTNIGDAITLGVTILNSREEAQKQNLSTIMLFTDGLANMGVRGSKLLQRLKQSDLPEGLAIHTFGYGLNHDSNLLQSISISSKGGMYYYIENTDCIASTFGECLAGLLSTVVHNVKVEMSAEDGCRIVAFYTKYSVQQIKEVKNYNVSLGSIYNEESKSIIFKLSLRKMEKPTKSDLVKITVSYIDTRTGQPGEVQGRLVVDRPSRAKLYPMPVPLDWNINRYASAAAIEEAANKATNGDYAGAQRHIMDMITSIQTSTSYKDKDAYFTCEDLIKDLEECMCGMSQKDYFQHGMHYSNAYSNMYYSERSCGTRNLAGIRRVVSTRTTEMSTSIVDSVWGRCLQRSPGYGYLTVAQEKESDMAQSAARSYVVGYL